MCRFGMDFDEGEKSTRELRVIILKQRFSVCIIPVVSWHEEHKEIPPSVVNSVETKLLHTYNARSSAIIPITFVRIRSETEGIPNNIICTLKSPVYEVCCLCYALSKSARNFPIEAIVKKLSMVTEFRVGYGWWARWGGGGITSSSLSPSASQSRSLSPSVSISLSAPKTENAPFCDHRG